MHIGRYLSTYISEGAMAVPFRSLRFNSDLSGTGAAIDSLVTYNQVNELNVLLLGVILPVRYARLTK